MKDARFFLNDLWRDLSGLPETEETVILPTIDELRKSEWSSLFESLMRNRLIMGAFRYGRLRAKGKKQYNRIEAIISRTDRYRRYGNLEDLVDIANIALCEFEEGDHPNKHFRSVDDGEHVK